MVLFYILTALLNPSRYIIYIWASGSYIKSFEKKKKNGKSLKFLTNYIDMNNTLVLKLLLFRYCITKTVIGFWQLNFCQSSCLLG